MYQASIFFFPLISTSRVFFLISWYLQKLYKHSYADRYWYYLTAVSCLSSADPKGIFQCYSLHFIKDKREFSDDKSTVAPKLSKHVTNNKRELEWLEWKLSTYGKNLFLYEELPNFVPEGGEACLIVPVWCSFHSGLILFFSSPLFFQTHCLFVLIVFSSSSSP